MIQLYKDLITIPITDELYDEIKMNQGSSFKNYEYLTDLIGIFCLEISKVSRTAYVEAEYFGGIGTQLLNAAFEIARGRELKYCQPEALPKG
ncbi:hypothetical protein [Paenibacillus sp. Soil787]|uniref:hypothetical protein n=1 Tax=Paenibacillus sp. Soil787 TaxID=1736411 RepID=UPI000702563C|nr:hypothetical protein [Paenibacillus sp. Soil787]KRF21786.1 hypothetical protein ASG93_30855 [Paenibacillus sp. Soil787]